MLRQRSNINDFRESLFNNGYFAESFILNDSFIKKKNNILYLLVNFFQFNFSYVMLIFVTLCARWIFLGTSLLKRS